jgi:chromosome partitioning protein
MTRRIAILQQKGGVGKTTNTINVAGALADRGLSVLAVDMDPQGYLTHRLGFKDAYEADSPTLHDALKSPNDAEISEIVVEHAEFDLLPANVDMFLLEQDLIASGMRPRTRLRTLLEDAHDWDVIVVDAPPSLGPLNDNVALATEELLVPVEADDSSRLAVNHLLRQLDTLEAQYDVQIDFAGVMVSNVDYPLDNEQEENIEWFQERFAEHVPLWIIRHRVAIERAVKNDGSIFAEDAEDTDMRGVYEEIAEVLMDGR